ncbi:glucose-6-phosphate isomerase family protein [Vibrio tapetis subsp. quintayensis]|uniref:glucose-6-phosphate isomerase family protein n=1 Tax=Vibrio tapetis TaxID=52443 RepID=UPI0025B5CA66|nr:glucose-6-phosphate isomerase family protein [Vibrio tapetis]MDN3681148.1 glucose-6-phosphate isomerase family protein [Vibrio tapetis subsp. quintayensis]
MPIALSISPSIDFNTGQINTINKQSKVTKLSDLQGVFRDTDAYQAKDSEQTVYQVEMLPAQSAEGELNFGVTHLEAGTVGDEFYMTRGHFHQRIEQAEFYLGCQGEGLLVLQDEQGEVRVENVFAGSVHHIGSYLAHRLVNTGKTRLSAMAVWPAVAGHNYDALKQNGFNVSVIKDGDHYRLVEKP